MTLEVESIELRILTCPLESVSTSSGSFCTEAELIQRENRADSADPDADPGPGSRRACVT